jgi:hypothetical protein
VGISEPDAAPLPLRHQLFDASQIRATAQQRAILQRFAVRASARSLSVGVRPRSRRRANWANISRRKHVEIARESKANIAKPRPLGGCQSGM